MLHIPLEYVDDVNKLKLQLVSSNPPKCSTSQKYTIKSSLFAMCFAM